MLNFVGTMEGHIYIKGLIGSVRDEQGKVTERGVELADVISQVQALKGIPTIICHINSEGGFVDVGKKIAEYIASIPNLVTVAEELCASMGTEIHLAVPVERRKIVSGTRYVIHQPMLSFTKGVSLNSTQLAEMGDDILGTEKEMLAMYTKSTGLDKTALDLLMKQADPLTPEQCKQFGFVSEILPASPVKAVALITPKQKTNTEMSEIKTEVTGIKATLAAIAEKLGLTKKVSLDATTKDGFKIVIDTSEDAPKVGDKAMDENGKSLDPGKYETQWGTLVVVDGSIAEIIAPVAAENPEMEALKTELAALKAEREAEQAEIAALKTDVEAMAKLTSTYVPKTQKVAFKKVETSTEKEPKKSIKDAYKEKKEAAKK